MKSPYTPPPHGEPAVKTFSSNNDFDHCGVELDDALLDARFDLATWHEGFLLLRADLTKEQALATVENLRWLVEKSFEPNAEARVENHVASLPGPKALGSEALDELENMCRQHCYTIKAERDYNGQVAGTLVTDSGALSVNADALRTLAAAILRASES
jgi:hypothetical protein